MTLSGNSILRTVLRAKVLLGTVVVLLQITRRFA